MTFFYGYYIVTHILSGTKMAGGSANTLTQNILYFLIGKWDYG